MKTFFQKEEIKEKRDGKWERKYKAIREAEQKVHHQNNKSTTKRTE